MGMAPTGGSIHNVEEMDKTPGTGNRSNQVRLNVAELTSWHRNLRNRGVNVLENLTLLTVQTAGPLGDILREAGPDKGSPNQSLGRKATRVRHVV